MVTDWDLWGLQGEYVLVLLQTTGEWLFGE